MKKNIEKETESIDTLQQRVSELADQAKVLTKQLRAARGTRDIVRPPSASEYFVGDEGPTPDLMDAVLRLVQKTPTTFQELLDMTGARDNRIKGVLMRLQKERGVELLNLGTEQRALWFVPDPALLRRLKAGRGRARRTTKR